MILYVNGCSHTEDISNIKYGNPTWPVMFMEKMTSNFDYFRIIGNQLNNRTNNTYINFNDVKSDILINDSVCGASNDYIFHTSLESINLLIKENHKPKFVVIQWSGPNRREWCDVNGILRFITPYDNTELHLKFEPMGSFHTLHYIYSLQEFLKSNGIDYLFFNYMGLDKSIKNKNTFKNLDLDRIIDFGNDTLHNGLIDFFKEKNYVRDIQGHPNEKGFEFITKKIVEKFVI